MRETQQRVGLVRTRRRLSDQETERRMLEAAAAAVNRSGLTVSLEHLSFEDVIRDAGVSRSTAYRRWPYKDLFFADLLKEIARAATPAEIADEETSIPALAEIVARHADWLRSPERRADLLLELMRLGSEHDFDMLRTSTEWRTYLALHATFMSVADEQLRGELQAALADSERDFVSRVAASWRRLSGLLGFRLRPELNTSFETFATIVSADLRGHVILALANPDVATDRVHGKLFGAAPADWSLPAIAIASIAGAFFEPDPDAVWDEARITTLVEAFGATAATLVEGFRGTTAASGTADTAAATEL